MLRPELTILPSAKLACKRNEPRFDIAKTTSDLRFGQNRNIIFRKINPGLQQRNQPYQFLLGRLHPSRDRSSQPAPERL